MATKKAVKSTMEPRAEAVPAQGRTLLITTTEGDVRVTIPAGGRVTFGPTIPYEKKNDYDRQTGYSLRVYENSKNDSLVAVFAGVKCFRDVAIPHAKLIIREAGKSVWKSDEEGYKVEEEVKRTANWVDPLRQLETGF